MAYVSGNAITENSIVLPEIQKNAHSGKNERVSKQVRKNRNKALHMSAGYVVFLAVATIVALMVCVRYLQLQSEITNRSRNIVALQRELTALKEDNMTRYNSVLGSVNLEEVREKAMNEFGMVYANPDQIIKYNSPTSNSVTMYESIPESGVVAGSSEVEK